MIIKKTQPNLVLTSINCGFSKKEIDGASPTNLLHAFIVDLIVNIRSKMSCS